MSALWSRRVCSIPASHPDDSADLCRAAPSFIRTNQNEKRHAWSFSSSVRSATTALWIRPYPQRVDQTRWMIRSGLMYYDDGEPNKLRCIGSIQTSSCTSSYLCMPFSCLQIRLVLLAYQQYAFTGKRLQPGLNVDKGQGKGIWY